MTSSIDPAARTLEPPWSVVRRDGGIESFAAIHDHEPRPGRDRLAARQLGSADLTVPLGFVPDVSHQVERNLGRAGDLLVDNDLHGRDATRQSATASSQPDAGSSKQCSGRGIPKACDAFGKWITYAKSATVFLARADGSAPGESLAASPHGPPIGDPPADLPSQCSGLSRAVGRVRRPPRADGWRLMVTCQQTDSGNRPGASIRAGNP